MKFCGMRLNDLLIGSLAGLTATAPMTLVMEAMHGALPAREQYPLPPREITDELTQQTGLRGELSEEAQRGLTLAAHFGYGAACGALYAPVARALSLPPVAGGVAYGLGVWTVSYLGLLPAAGILRPATEHPARRNALMIAAHVVWGACAGVLVDRLSALDRR
jgi:uncharacterized membrane protein YagU involved in acid resistance